MTKQQEEITKTLEAFAKMEVSKKDDTKYNSKSLLNSKLSKSIGSSIGKSVTFADLDSEVLESARKQANEAILKEQSPASDKNTNQKRSHRRSNYQISGFYGRMGEWTAESKTNTTSSYLDATQHAGEKTAESLEPSIKKKRTSQTLAR